MKIYVGLSIVVISYVVSKYYQFKSFKYLKDEYEYVKIDFLIHGILYPNKIYSSPEGIRLKRIGGILFTIGVLLAVIASILIP